MIYGTHRILIGDVLDRLRELPDESVHCCVTSPPYWGLRDYGTAKWEGGSGDCDHNPVRSPRSQRASHGLEGGRESVDAGTVFRSVCGRCGARRVDAQIGLESTPEEYIGKMVAVFREVRRVLRSDGTCWGNWGDSYNGQKDGNTEVHKNPKLAAQSHHRKELWRALKPKDLCGIPWRVALALQADGWWLRQDIIWAKPNPMPESVTDRCTKAHEYIFLLTKSARYWYDAEAIREKSIRAGDIPGGDNKRGVGQFGVAPHAAFNGPVPENRNARSVWTINTQPYSEAHFATFPEALPERCIKAGCPEGGTVLDPFSGSGTSGAVACRLGRNYVGIELNPEYAAMSERRIGRALRPSTYRAEVGDDAGIFAIAPRPSGA